MTETRTTASRGLCSSSESDTRTPAAERPLRGEDIEDGWLCIRCKRAERDPRRTMCADCLDELDAGLRLPRWPVGVSPNAAFTGRGM